MHASAYMSVSSNEVLLDPRVHHSDTVTFPYLSFPFSPSAPNDTTSNISTTLPWGVIAFIFFTFCPGALPGRPRAFLPLYLYIEHVTCQFLCPV